MNRNDTQTDHLYLKTTETLGERNLKSVYGSFQKGDSFFKVN